MEPQVAAAVINAGGTCLAACIVLFGGWIGLAREIRHRKRVEQQHELFERALNDCVDFVREVKTVSHALGVAAYDMIQSRQEGGLALVRRIDEITAGLGRAGWLAPPVLTAQRDAATQCVRDLRAAILEGVNDREHLLPKYNAVVRELNEAVQAFIRGFEAWKAEDWNDGA